jgi:hypothetical protein
LRGGDWIVVEREGNEKHESSIEQQLFEAQAEATRLAGELELQKKNTEHCKESFEYYYKRKKEVDRERDEARALANDLIDMLSRSMATIYDLELINSELMDKRGHNGKTAKRDARGRFIQVAKGHPNHRPPKPQPKRKYHENPELIPKPEPTEPAIDWSKPVAFPDGYVATAGKSVYVLSQYMPKGEIIIWYGHLCSVRLEDGEIIRCSSHQLAPENPADHPLHPEFKDSKGNTLP